MPEGYDDGYPSSEHPALRTLWPKTEPYTVYRLQVSNIHNLYIEECGNPLGTPVLVLHGGPGAGSYPQLRRFFNPKAYRIILFDQRGCGKSTPFTELRGNTTQALVEDIESIREHLGIERWIVFGGSWGSTLALVYAETFPERVRALIVRGIFLGQKKEIDWLYEGGLAMIAHDRWERFISHVPGSHRGNIVKAYWQRLSRGTKENRFRAAQEWWRWESANSELVSNPAEIEEELSDVPLVTALALIECHYFCNACFLRPEQLLRNVKMLEGIPGVIVQGYYDLVCPAGSAWELHKAWPGAQLYMNYRSGHAAGEPENTHRLICAAEQFENAK